MTNLLSLIRNHKNKRNVASFPFVLPRVLPRVSPRVLPRVLPPARRVLPRVSPRRYTHPKRRNHIMCYLVFALSYLSIYIRVSSVLHRVLPLT